MEKTIFDRWKTVFRMNLERRSRTAKGQDKGSASSSRKRPLLLSGQELAERTRANGERLIAHMAEIATDRPSNAFYWIGVTDEIFDIVNAGIVGVKQYAEDHAALKALCERHAQIFGERPISLNVRYRLWTPAYLRIPIPPFLLSEFLERFFGSLNVRVADTVDAVNAEMAIETMALADYALDGIIHPWLDGCGRISTAVVMHLASIFENSGVSGVLPLFAETHEEHTQTLDDLRAHQGCMRACVMRARTHFG